MIDDTYKGDKDPEAGTYQPSDDTAKSEVRYRHIRPFMGRGAVTIAYVDLGPSWRFGWSFCSPSEQNFSRFKGRSIALGRLVDDPIDIPKVNTLPMVYHITYLVLKLHKENRLPQWVTRGFLRDHELFDSLVLRAISTYELNRGNFSLHKKIKRWERIMTNAIEGAKNGNP